MEEISNEKEALASAKRDLLMRFIKDQETLQTSQSEVTPCNEDRTFDILDGVACHNVRSPNNKLCDFTNNNVTGKLHERGRPASAKHRVKIAQKCSAVNNGTCPRPKSCLSSQKLWSDIKLNTSDLGTKEERLRFEKLQFDLNQNGKVKSGEQCVRRLRSAPQFSFNDSGDLLKQRKAPSLSIVVPSAAEMKVEQDTSRTRHTVKCVAARPLNTVGISSVDLEVLERRLPLTNQLTMFHLPPITTKTTSAPPST